MSTYDSSDLLSMEDRHRPGNFRDGAGKDHRIIIPDPALGE
jgi:hypothetical protein